MQECRVRLRRGSKSLSDRYQRVVLPTGASDLVCVRAGVPQGSILGPLLFLVYIIVKYIGSNINLFTDDTCLSMVVDNPNVAGDLHHQILIKFHFGPIDGLSHLIRKNLNL